VGDYEAFYCSGTLIAANLVVTADHCGNPWCVYLKGNDVSRPEDGEILRVTQLFSHPEVDLMVLLLERASQVRPRHVAQGIEVAGATMATLVGFGTIDQDGTIGYGRKRKVEVPIVSLDGGGLGEAKKYGCLPGREVVAGHRGLLQDSCRGDSGGPLYIRNAQGEYYLLGATSRGVANGFRACGDGGVYVRVDLCLDWIRSVTAAEIEGPAPERKRRGTMLWDRNMTNLRNILAGLYWNMEDARRVVLEAGMNPAYISFSSRIINTWQSILEEAQKHSRVPDIIAVARKDTPRYKLWPWPSRTCFWGWRLLPSATMHGTVHAKARNGEDHRRDEHPASDQLLATGAGGVASGGPRAAARRQQRFRLPDHQQPAHHNKPRVAHSRGSAWSGGAVQLSEDSTGTRCAGGLLSPGAGGGFCHIASGGSGWG